MRKYLQQEFCKECPVPAPISQAACCNIPAPFCWPNLSHKFRTKPRPGESASSLPAPVQALAQKRDPPVPLPCSKRLWSMACRKQDKYFQEPGSARVQGTHYRSCGRQDDTCLLLDKIPLCPKICMKDHPGAHALPGLEARRIYRRMMAARQTYWPRGQDWLLNGHRNWKQGRMNPGRKAACSCPGPMKGRSQAQIYGDSGPRNILPDCQNLIVSQKAKTRASRYARESLQPSRWLRAQFPANHGYPAPKWDVRRN